MRWTAIILLAAGCAAAADANNTDGGYGDGGGVCDIPISLSPPNPQAGDTVIATGTPQNTPLGAFLDTTWTVYDPDANVVATTRRDSAGLMVSFVAAKAGLYEIQAKLDADSNLCALRTLAVNVATPGAQHESLRLRYVPTVTQLAPPQVDPVTLDVRGGADYNLPAARVLDDGAAIAGHVAGPSGAIAAYLRLDAASSFTELFAGVSGAYGAVIQSGTYALLVVPDDPTIAPERYAAQASAQLNAGYTLTAGDLVQGVLRDFGGAPIAGARVGVGTGTLPPSPQTTAADGSFSARVRGAEGALTLSITPPAPLAALQLGAATGVTVADGAQLDVRLANVPIATFSAQAQRPAGVALPFARVTFVATSLAPAGSVAVNGGAAASIPASARTVVFADSNGALPSISLPRGVYQVLADLPPTDGPGVSTLDLTTDPVTPPVFTTAQTVAHGIVVANDAMRVLDARVIAVARGIAGVGAGATEASYTSTTGVASLPLVPGMTYDLVIDPPRGARYARSHTVLVGLSSPTSVPITLPTGIYVNGTLVFSSGAGQPGITVQASCVAPCPAGQDPAWAVAETTTTAGGAFELLIPDPGK